ncbi:chaperone protein dnaJ 11, chloroplastic-like [Olea europaea var. sylvestris]|uniref:chaperone protein dnaJ 11, chloroplastic-like n=1 Tax=Olea europaea var. sylvestris TaxID=158386 RepID=UPI000C1D5DE9|nr:chaperone protein dnaJ 11, chloroplastic-like [Olea europaea var. sylvestris]
MLATSVFPCKSLVGLQSHHRHMSIRSGLARNAPLSVAAVDRRSLYEVLRVKHNASQTEIKTAYRTLAKIYHPDARSRFMNSSISSSSSSSDGRSFIEIHDAYNTLSDPEARAVYDLKLSIGSQRRRPPPSSVYGYRRFNPTRRWETDQCW